MTFSICVREDYENGAGERHRRFGVAVTTRLPGVGTLCPFVSEHGAVATQSLVNVDLGEQGLEAAAEAYEASAVHDTADHSTGPSAVTADVDTEPLAKRLIDALAAGDREGGDKREELAVQSAAVVATTESHAMAPPYNDLRIDATETPIADLRETDELATRGYEETLAQYEGAFEADSLDEAAD